MMWGKTLLAHRYTRSIYVHVHVSQFEYNWGGGYLFLKQRPTLSILYVKSIP